MLTHPKKLERCIPCVIFNIHRSTSVNVNMDAVHVVNETQTVAIITAQ